MSAPAESPPKQRTHSKYSILSCALALGIGAANITLFILSETLSPGSDWKNRVAVILFFLDFLLIAPLLHLTGLIFGIMGVCKKDSKKSLAILGIIGNILLAVVLWFLTLPSYMHLIPNWT